jgi:serine/threonine-protein kinase RsbW
VIVQVSDNGCGYQLRANEKPKTPTDMKLERGRGIKLMRMLADEVSISMKSGGKGTAVSLTKMIE